MLQDVLENAWCITKADVNTPIRFQAALIDLLGGRINTRRRTLERQPVPVRYINNGSIHLLPFEQVPISDWMRLFTLEELERAPDCHEDQQDTERRRSRTTNPLPTQPCVLYEPSALQIRVSRTPTPPKACMFFWRYIVAPDLKNLCECFDDMITPASSDRLAVSSITMTTRYKIDKLPRSCPVDYNPTSPRMKERGRATQELFDEFVPHVKRRGNKSKRHVPQPRTSSRAEVSSLAATQASPLEQQFTIMEQTVTRL